MTQVILGGGISGLSAAYYLRLLDSSSRIIVLEASNRLGGWVNSIQSNGITLELGPRTLRAVGKPGANTLALAEELNLTDKIKYVTKDQPAAKNRMIYIDGKLHKLPNSLKTALKTTPPFTKPLLLQALGDLRKPKVLNNDESLFSFVNRRFGPEVANYAIDPLARGVFAGNAKDLSVMSLAKRLHEVEQMHGSVLKGLFKDRKNATTIDGDLLKSKLVQQAREENWAVWSLEGGLNTLVSTLNDVNQKNSIEIRTNFAVNNISNNNNGKLKVHSENETIECDNIISCLPANHIGKLAQNLNKDLSLLLSNIPFATVVVVNLVFEGNLISDPGFGYLVPSSQKSKVLGVIYDSCVFEYPNKSIFTLMMGGYWYEQYFGVNYSEKDFLKIALEELSKTLNINKSPLDFRVSILKDCIPQYTVGHYERVHNARKIIKDHNLNLWLAGNSYEGVGVNDAILNSKICASNMFNYVNESR